MSIADEIRQQIEKNGELRLLVGEINTHLSILEGLLRKDIEERTNEAYKKGYDEGYQKGYADKENNDEVCKELAFEEKKESEIRIGDVLKSPYSSNDNEFVAVSFGTTFDGKPTVCGFTTNNGNWLAIKCEDAVRTNKHHDCIEAIMKETE